MDFFWILKYIHQECASTALQLQCVKNGENYGWTVSKMFRHLYAVCQYSSGCTATPSHSKMLSAPAPNPAWYQPCCRWNAWCAGRDHRREWLKARHQINSLPWLLKSTAFRQRMTWGSSLSQKASSMILDSHGETVRPKNLMTWKPNRNYEVRGTIDSHKVNETKDHGLKPQHDEFQIVPV